MKLLRIIPLLFALPLMAQSPTVETFSGAKCNSSGLCGPAALVAGTTVVGQVWVNDSGTTLFEYDTQGQNGETVSVSSDGSFPASGPYPAGVLNLEHYSVYVRGGSGRYAYSSWVPYVQGTITTK